MAVLNCPGLGVTANGAGSTFGAVSATSLTVSGASALQTVTATSITLGNNQFLNGTTTGAVTKNLIGVDATNKVNIDASALGTVFGSTVTIASGLTVTAGGITVSAGGITASGQTVTASNFVGNWAGYGNNLPSGPFAGAPDSIIGLSTSTVQRYTAGGLVNFLGGKQTITGSKGANAALASLLTGLVALGLVTDSTT